MNMKTPKTKFMLIAALAIVGMTGMASAQSGQFGEYATSEQVSTFNTESGQIAFEFSNISSEDVTVELLDGENVSATAEDVALDSSGFGAVNISEPVETDAIAVYPSDSEATSVDSVTLYYDYSGTDVTSTANYSGDTTFSEFSITDGSMAFFMYILPWLIVLAVIGLITQEG